MLRHRLDAVCASRPSPTLAFNVLLAASEAYVVALFPPPLVAKSLIAGAFFANDGA